MFVTPVLRARSPTSFAADAGAFDFPKVKLDEKRRVLCRDGKPIRRRKEKDKNGRIISSRIVGEIALVTDDYDEADMMEHCRAQALDWQNACELLADLARGEEKNAKRPEKPMTLAVASDKFNVCRMTLKRHISAGSLKSYRCKDAPKNSPHIVDERDVAKRWPRRGLTQ